MASKELLCFPSFVILPLYGWLHYCAVTVYKSGRPLWRAPITDRAQKWMDYMDWVENVFIGWMKWQDFNAVSGLGSFKPPWLDLDSPSALSLSLSLSHILTLISHFPRSPHRFPLPLPFLCIVFPFSFSILRSSLPVLRSALSCHLP